MTRHRSGSLFWECVAWFGCALPLIGAAWGIIVALMRQGAPPDGSIADLACERLRRDAVAGAAIDAGALHLGGHRWLVADGFLERDGAQRLRVDAVTWTVDGGVVTVRLAPHGLPPRTLELGR